MIPDRRSPEIDVEVCVAAFYAHETIPAAEKTEGIFRSVSPDRLPNRIRCEKQKAAAEMPQTSTSAQKIAHNQTYLPLESNCKVINTAEINDSVN